MPSVKSILSSFRHVITLLFSGFLAVVFLVGGSISLFNSPLSPSEMQVATVTGTLAERPEIHNYGKHPNIRLLLKEYPNRSFNIDGSAFSATRWVNLGEGAYSGDTVVMEVSADDYKSNIEVQMPDRMLPVDVYALKSKESVYLSLTGYCREYNDDTAMGIIALIMGGLFVWALYFEVRNRKRRKVV